MVKTRSFTYESYLQKLASQRATSRAFRGRSIRRADGPDRASRGHFSKQFFYFLKINPRSRGPLSIFCKKTPQIISKSTRSLDRMGSGFFANKTFSLSKINPCSRDPLNNFYEKLLRFFSNLTFKPPLIISLFLKKIAATRRRRARVEAAAPWLEFAHGEHAPQGLELSFDCEA